MIRGLNQGELHTLLKSCLPEVKTQHFSLSKNITTVQNIMTMLQTECKFGMHQGKFLAYFERHTKSIIISFYTCILFTCVKLPSCINCNFSQQSLFTA